MISVPTDITINAIDYNIASSGTTWIIQGNADGTASKTLDLMLGRNALVRKFTVRVGAQRAHATTLANAGQPRLQAESKSSKTVVVDFGMLRTVSDVGVALNITGAAISVNSIVAWQGAQFDTAELLLIEGGFEVRTERVKLVIQTTETLANIADRVWLQFPDLPADLELRVNNGPPAWAARGPAQPTTKGWDANSGQLVDLTIALAALLGDPTASGDLPVEILLSSRIPGLLELDEQESDIVYLARLTVDKTQQAIVDFETEGVKDFVLELPPWVDRVEELRLTMTASPGAERILPPVGPNVAGGSSTPTAELLLDVDHAAAARLTSSLAEHTAVRLPLTAGKDGAEVRITLYDGEETGPTTPVDGGTSAPVLLESRSADAVEDQWVSFTFPAPVRAPKSGYRWAVVSVARGMVTWPLGIFDSAALVVPLKRGPIAGPWRSLPHALANAELIGGRLREVGTPAKDTPVAPFQVEVVGTVSGGSLDVTPAPKGTRVTWLPDIVTEGVRPQLAPGGSGSAKQLTLRLTSRVVGRLTLDLIDLVATRTL